MAVREAMDGKLPYIDRGGKELFGQDAKNARQFDVRTMGEAGANQNQRNLHLQKLSSMGITPVQQPRADIGTTQSMRAPNAGDTSGSQLDLMKNRIAKGVNPEQAKREYLETTKSKSTAPLVKSVTNLANLVRAESGKNIASVQNNKMSKGAFVAGELGAVFNAVDYTVASAIKPTEPEDYSDFWHTMAPNLTARLDTDTGFLAGMGRTALTLATPANLIPFGAGTIGKAVGLGIMAASSPAIVESSIGRIKEGDVAGAVGELTALAAPFALHGISRAHSSLVNEGAIRSGLRNLNNLTPEEMVKLADGVNASPKFKNINSSLPVKEALQNVTPVNINKPKLADTAYLKAAKSTLSNLITKTPDGYDVTLINGKKVGIRYGADESQTNIADPVTGEKLMGYDDVIWLKDGAGDAEMKHELFHTVVRLGLAPQSLIDAGIKRYGSVEAMAREYEAYKAPSGPIGYLKQLGSKLVDMVSDRGKLAFTRMAEKIDNMDAYARPSEMTAPLEPAYYTGNKSNATETDVISDTEISPAIKEAGFVNRDITVGAIPEVVDSVTDRIVRKSKLSDDPALRTQQIEVIRQHVERLVKKRLPKNTSPSDKVMSDEALYNFVKDRFNLKDLTDVIKGDQTNVDRAVSMALDHTGINADAAVIVSLKYRVNSMVKTLHKLGTKKYNESQLGKPVTIKDFGEVPVEGQVLAPVDAVIASPKKGRIRSIIDVLDEHLNDEHAPMLSALRDVATKEVDPVWVIFGKDKVKPTLNLLEVDLRLFSGSAVAHLEKLQIIKKLLVDLGADVNDFKVADEYLKTGDEAVLTDGSKTILHFLTLQVNRYLRTSTLVNGVEFKASGVNPVNESTGWKSENFHRSLEDIRRYADIKEPITSLSEVFRGLLKAGELSDREMMKTKIITLAGEAGLATEISKQKYDAIQHTSNRKSGTLESVDNISVVIVDGRARYILAVPEITNSIRILENLTPETRIAIVSAWQKIIRLTKRSLVSMPAFLLRNFSRDVQDRWIRGSRHRTGADASYSDIESAVRMNGGSTEGYYMQSPEEYIAHMDEILGLAKQGKLSIYKGWMKLSSKVESLNRTAEFSNARIEMILRLKKEGSTELGIKSEAQMLADNEALKGQTYDALLEMYNAQTDTPAFKLLEDQQAYTKEAYVNEESLRKAIGELEIGNQDIRINTIAGKYGAYMSRSLMDFAKGGKTTKFLDKNWLPFINPSTQGVIRTLKYAKSHPLEAFAKFSAVILLPRLIAQAINSSQDALDEYKDLPTWRREMGLNIKIGPNKWLFIPQPFENALFGGLVERGVGAAFGKDDLKGIEPFKALAGVFSLDEGMFMGPVGALSELKFNKKTLTGGNIIPTSQAGLKVSERTTKIVGLDTDTPKIRTGAEDATFISKMAAPVLGVATLSPDKIDPRALDYLMEAQFGGPARFINAAQKALEAKVTGNRNISGKLDWSTFLDMFGVKQSAGSSSQLYQSARTMINEYGLTYKKDEMDESYDDLRKTLNDTIKQTSDLSYQLKASTDAATKQKLSDAIRDNGVMLYAIAKGMVKMLGK